MEEKGLVSVIIPVYNVEKYLRECVDSVLSQTYINYEIILVDDGSTDSSGAICDEYAEKYENITVVHKDNSGLSDARNIGLLSAKGEYIYFLDSDDYIADELLSLSVSAIEKDDADFVFFDAKSFVDEGKNFNIPQTYLRKFHYIADSGIATLTRLCENKDYHSAVQMYLYKKEFLKKNNLLFLSGLIYEDIFFSYQAFCIAERVAHINKQLYYRRYRSNSIMTSQKNARHFQSICQVYCHIVQFSQEKEFREQAVANNYITRCAFNVFNIYDNLCREDKQVCRDELKCIKKHIVVNNAYGNKALEMRCYGKVFWFIYKVYEKTLGRLFV